MTDGEASKYDNFIKIHCYEVMGSEARCALYMKLFCEMETLASTLTEADIRLLAEACKAVKSPQQQE